MRIIIVGDKSRYQFLKMMAFEEVLEKEIWNKTIRIISEKSKEKDTIYSAKLPLNTELIFPAELNWKNYTYTNNDMILLFDEFPFRTKEKRDALQWCINNTNTMACKVILVSNERKFLESDISTEKEALEEACKEYQNANICVEKYTMGEFPQILFYPNSFTNYVKMRMLEKIKKLYHNLELMTSGYELDYLWELKDKVENIGVLDDFFSYSSSWNIKKVDVKKNIYIKTEQYFFEDNEIFEFSKKIYMRCVDEICIWNINEDLDSLYNKIKLKFKNKMNERKSNFFQGNEYEYVQWKQNNIQYILETKKDVIKFFKEDLQELIKNQAYQRINRLEELINEKSI